MATYITKNFRDVPIGKEFYYSGSKFEKTTTRIATTAIKGKFVTVTFAGTEICQYKPNIIHHLNQGAQS